MKPYTPFTSVVVPLLRDNVDTDQIIPARFLKITDRLGLGDHLFADWRYDAKGTPVPDFVLNRPAFAGAQILLAGANFGCGSSREHAPWALAGWGFRAVISTSFGDIFRNNCLKNGLLPIQITAAEHSILAGKIASTTAFQAAVDLEGQRVTIDRQSFSFPLDPFSRHCLLNGVDELEYLLTFRDQIARYEVEHAKA